MLAGWVFDIALLKWVPRGMVMMKANAAFAFLLSGISLGLLAPGNDAGGRGKVRIAQGLALLVALLGVAARTAATWVVNGVSATILLS